MFEHLDDPAPWRPSDDLRTKALARGRTLRRRRRILAGALGALGAVVAATAVGGLLVDRNLGRIDRVRIASVDQPHEPVAITEPTVIVFAGVDSDAGLAAGDRDRDRDPAKRSDTVVVARLDPQAHRLTVLPLPRDLWVDLPGHGPGRINQATALGGPDLLVRTVEQLLDVQVDHYVETDFAGAVAIGDALGGVRLDATAPLRDARSGLALDAGCQVIRGGDLLALGRARHLEVQLDGRWEPDGTGDLGRIERQQAIAATVVGMLTDLGDRDPAELYRLTDALADHVTVDAGLDRGHLLGLARALQGVELVERRIEVTPATHGGADVLEPTSQARHAFDEPGATEPSTPDGVVPVAGEPDAAVPRGC